MLLLRRYQQMGGCMNICNGCFRAYAAPGVCGNCGGSIRMVDEAAFVECPECHASPIGPICTHGENHPGVFEITEEDNKRAEEFFAMHSLRAPKSVFLDHVSLDDNGKASYVFRSGYIPPPISVQITDPESLASIDKLFDALNTHVKIEAMRHLDQVLESFGVARGFSLTPVWGWRYAYHYLLDCKGWIETDELFRKRISKSFIGCEL